MELYSETSEGLQGHSSQIFSILNLCREGWYMEMAALSTSGWPRILGRRTNHRRRQHFGYSPAADYKRQPTMNIAH